MEIKYGINRVIEIIINYEKPCAVSFCRGRSAPAGVGFYRPGFFEMNSNRIILPITPQTWVRAIAGKHGSQVLFRIPEVCSKGRKKGQPCSIYLRSLKKMKIGGVVQEVGICKHTLSYSGRLKKRQIEKYNKYRVDVYHLAKQAGFELPSCGWSLYFYFPVPVRWSKSKKNIMHGQFHMIKPDIDNLCKAFFDSLAIADQGLAQLSGIGKFWVNQETGYIEILTNQSLYNPLDVELLDKDRKISMIDLMQRRNEKTEKRKAMRELRRSKKRKVKKKSKPVTQKYLFSRKDIIQ